MGLTRSREGLEQADGRETAEENCRDRARKVVTKEEDKGFALCLPTMPRRKKKLLVLSTHSLAIHNPNVKCSKLHLDFKYRSGNKSRDIFVFLTELTVETNITSTGTRLRLSTNRLSSSYCLAISA
jgi:hypothetical protein